MAQGRVKKVYLVTGGAGFIGSHLCERLLTDGHAVVCLDNFCSSYDPRIKERNLSTCLEANDFHLIRGDILDSALLTDVFRGDRCPKPERVVHLAALANVRDSIANPLAYVDIDIKGTVQLLEVCCHEPVDRFVFASSAAVYGASPKDSLSEGDPTDAPISQYAAAKCAGELYCRTYHHLYNSPIVILRFFTVYGPRQSPDMAIHRFARKLLDGEALPMYGDGTSERDYVYISDVVDAICAAVAGPDEFAVYNIASGRTTRLSDVIAALGRALNADPGVERLPMQPGDVQRAAANIERAMGRIGYVPRVGLEEGIERFVTWLTAEREIER